MTISRPVRRIVFVYSLPDSPKPHRLLRGNVRDWLREEGIPAMWTNRLRGWFIHEDRVADIVARAEAAGIAVRMRGVYVVAEPDPTPRQTPIRGPQTIEVPVDGQLALLEVGEAS
ncbi:hypothetical protein [Phycicoccus avicenniae]|uniref:hypothetical protein n=1 Tax=Phycicoccus avicenniae TaxID=2828860 RepID=UPI003D2894F4